MKRDTKALKEQLIAVGVSDIKEKGIDQLSIRSVAQRCGITHGAPYRHFGSKDGYLEVLVQEISKDFSQHMIAGISTNLSAREKLTTMGENVISYAKHFPHFFEVLFVKYPTTFLTVGNDDIVASNEFPGFTTVTDTINALIKEEKLALTEKTVVLHLWSYIFGLAMITKSDTASKLSHQTISENLQDMLSNYIKGGQA